MRLTAHSIAVATATYFELSPNMLRSPSRMKHIVQARRVAIYLMRTRLALSLPGIGIYFRQDHTTILSALRRIEADLDLLGHAVLIAASLSEPIVPQQPRHCIECGQMIALDSKVRAA